MRPLREEGEGRAALGDGFIGFGDGLDPPRQDKQQYTLSFVLSSAIVYVLEQSYLFAQLSHAKPLSWDSAGEGQN